VEIKQGQSYDVIDSFGIWCEGIVNQINADNKSANIHYQGWPSRWDEWINYPCERIRPCLSQRTSNDVGKPRHRNLQDLKPSGYTEQQCHKALDFVGDMDESQNRTFLSALRWLQIHEDLPDRPEDSANFNQDDVEEDEQEEDDDLPDDKDDQEFDILPWAHK